MDIPSDLNIGCAVESEQRPALELLFAHCIPAEQQRRVEYALELIQQGPLKPEELCVVRSSSGILGSILWQSLPGAIALLWPPQTCVEDGQVIEDALIHFALNSLKRATIKVVQVLLESEEIFLAESLLRNHFQQMGGMWYLRHFLEISAETLSRPSSLHWVNYQECESEEFEQTLLRCTQDSLDCPELHDVLTIEEMLIGHRAAGHYDPTLWWLVYDQAQPVGIALIADYPETSSWEVDHVAVVPESRGKGIGREMMRFLLNEAKLVNRRQLTLTVDARNTPARRLYQSLGFEPYEYREVYLSILNSSKNI